MNIREVIADLVFVVRAPIDGIEEAIDEVANLSKAWRKIATVMKVLNSPWALPRNYRRELLGIANTYFSAGSDPSVTFMALLNKYNALLNQWSEWQGQALTAMIVMAIMIGVLSFLAILDVPPVVSIVGLVLIPMIHYFQVEVVKYDYVKPSIAAVITGVTAFTISQYILRLGLSITQLALPIGIAAGAGFAALYMPQFTKFIRDYMGMSHRVLESFGELLTVPNPRPPRPVTIVERELRPLWEYAYSVGMREFIERVNIVVDSLITFIRRTVTTGLIYGPFTAVSYAFMIFVAYLLHGINMTSMTGVSVPIALNPQTITLALVPLAVTTAVITGKAIHSIGLGISLVPLFLLPIIPLVW